MGICTFTRDLARFQARQAAEAEADAGLERECSLVRSICSLDELESVARGAEIAVLEALVERLAERRIQRAQAATAEESSADRYEEIREHCF
ncbi:MAG TPA: hypothetical protein PK689_07140 [Kiritimatiellia bacterium]|jgi:hypothetical protein|nr:hypothetical protein [Kiritimatiellia bacterium]